MTKSTQLGLMSGFSAMFLINILYIIDPILLIQGYERLTLLLFAGFILYGVTKHRPTNLAPKQLEDLLTIEKDTDGDFANFGELLKIGFKIFVIGFIVKFAFVYFLFHFYDPHLIEQVKEASVQIFESYQDKTRDTQEILDQQLAKYKAQEFGPRLTDFLGIAMELTIGFAIAFLVAIFFKRERPDY